MSAKIPNTIKWVAPELGSVTMEMRNPRERYTESRRLGGAVGTALSKRGLTGTLTRVVRRAPNWGEHRLQVIHEGTHGLLLMYYPAYSSYPTALEFVGMCAAFRRLLGFAKKDQRRWYRVS